MLVVYLGGAWVFIEAFNFLIDKYGWDTAALDGIIALSVITFDLVSGIYNALISEMGQVGALRVISRTSTSIYAEPGISLIEIATELKPDLI